MYVYVLYRNPNRWRDLVEMAGRFLGVFQPSTPPRHGVLKGGTRCLWSHSCAFWQKLYKTKVAGHPWFSGGGHLFGPKIQIWKDLGPMFFWRYGHSLWRLIDKSDVVIYVPNSYLVRLDTLYLYPGSKGGPVGFWSLSGAFWQKLYKTKVAGHPQYSGEYLEEGWVLFGMHFTQ